MIRGDFLSFFDNFTENLTDIKNNLEIISQKLLENTKEIKDITKLKLDLVKEKRVLSNLYKELGIHYYKVYKNSDSNLNVAGQITKIDISLQKVSSIENSLNNFKKGSMDSPDSGLYLMEKKEENDE